MGEQSNVHRNCLICICTLFFHLNSETSTEGRSIGDVHDKSAPTEVQLSWLNAIYWLVSPYQCIG